MNGNLKPDLQGVAADSGHHDEISDDELERRMREKWFSAEFRGTGVPKLNDDEQKVAAKLLGKENANRLANSSRPFRYRPKLVLAEYYEVPPDGLMNGGWRIDVIEGGERQDHRHGMSEQQCMRELRELSDKGALVKKIETEWMKIRTDERRQTRQEARNGKKSAILNRLGDFRL